MRMSKVKPEIEKFLTKTKELENPLSATDEFLEVLKRENTRQIKEQLATDLVSLEVRLTHIEQQQNTIIQMLKSKLDLDGYEKEIMDLLKAKIEKE